MWIRLIFLALAGFAAWRLLRDPWTFSIVVGRTGVVSHSGIKTDQQKNLLRLLETVRFAEGSVTVRGRLNHAGQLQLKFTGPIDNDTRQQIRNFLAVNL